MAIYCLCEQANGKIDSQAFGAPNRYCQQTKTIQEETDFPPLSLMKTMRTMKTGAAQVIPVDVRPNNWERMRPRVERRHYPNVDVFECPTCRARIARDA